MTAISVPTGKYTQPLDIANKACFHWGVAKLTSFQDDAVQAEVASDLYEDSRRAEMRRNVWTFSCKRAFLRPLNTPLGPATTGGTLTNTSGLSGLLVPAAWSSTATYLHGSLVSYNGEVYQARGSIVANLEPDANPAAWDQFFGTLAVNQWVNGGNVNNPTIWAAGTTYASGTSVMGSDTNVYTSLANANIGHDPTTDGGVHWQLIGPAQNGSGYFAGELVYTQSGGVMSVFVSLSTGNSDFPGQFPSWSATPQYLLGNSVTSGGVTYQSQTDFNVGNQPVALWLNATVYGAGVQVLGSDNHLYTSTGAGNTGHNPVGNAGVNWTDNGVAPWGLRPNTQTDQMTGLNWLQLGSATVQGLQIIYPAGSGPLDQVATRNVYLLPNGFLREAPQDPKAGSTSYLGAPSGLAYDDWVFDGPFLISREVEPICLRFAADVQQVTAMDPMFCEMLALRISLDGNERVTQSAEKENKIGAEYKNFASEARTVNGIEQGATEPPEDDYITCRL